MTTDDTSLSRPDAAKYLGLSVGTLRNYHKDRKLVGLWSVKNGRWEYPLAVLDAFAAVNVLLCQHGERPLVPVSGPQQPAN